MVVAETLGKSLREVDTTMAPEELMLWSAYFKIKQEDQEEAVSKAKRGRR
jgi:hypothetical protein